MGGVVISGMVNGVKARWGGCVGVVWGVWGGVHRVCGRCGRVCVGVMCVWMGGCACIYVCVGGRGVWCA